MSITVQRKDLALSELVNLTESEPLRIEDVNKSLAELWRSASQQAWEQKEEAGGVALACLWNLVAFHANPGRKQGDAGGEPARHHSLLEQVTVSLPARVIHLEEWRDETAFKAGQEVEAWVSTNCLRSPGGHPTVCSEEIRIAGYGEEGHSHFPALVRAFLVPDLPVALIWLDDIPRKGKMLGQLLAMSDRMIIDSQHTTEPASLLAANDVIQATPGKIVDMSWLRLSPLRHLVADFFDPPGRAGQLNHLEAIRIEVGPAGRNTGLLLLGWLLSRCGFERVEAAPQTDRRHAARWIAHKGKAKGKGGKKRGGAESFPLDFTMRDGYGGLDGIFSITLEAGGDTFSIRDTDPAHVSVQGPDREAERIPLREMDGAGLVVSALGGGPPDRIYGAALALAATLAESERQER